MGRLALLVAGSLAVAGCVGSRVAAPPPVAPVAPVRPAHGASDEVFELREYRICRGDMLDVRIYGRGQLAALYETPGLTVDSSGRIVLPLIGEMAVAGMTMSDCRDRLSREFGKHLVSPIIHASLVRRTGSKVYVLGEVASPGIQIIESRTTSMEAILTAGGFTADAQRDRVVLIRPWLTDGEGPEEDAGAERVALDFERLLEKADIRANVVLSPGDILYVPPMRLASSSRFHQHLQSILAPYLAIFRLGGDIWLLNEAISND